MSHLLEIVSKSLFDLDHRNEFVEKNIDLIYMQIYCVNVISSCKNKRETKTCLSSIHFQSKNHRQCENSVYCLLLLAYCNAQYTHIEQVENNEIPKTLEFSRMLKSI